MILHGYWRSTASYRVRLALALKDLSYTQVAHDLRTGAHRDDAYVAMNRQGLVPTLVTHDATLVQSSAILEWLEEAYPNPALLPVDRQDRAIVRAMVAVVGCDIHPLNNLRVLQALRTDFDADEAAVDRWIARWITAGFEALEHMIDRYGGRFAFGDGPTFADCYLVPQVYAAERFAVDTAPFPQIMAATRSLRLLPGIGAARPELQPDADR